MPTSTRATADAGAITDAVLANRLRLATGRLARQLRKRHVAGLTPSQLSALSTIEQHGPIRLGDLAERECVSPPTLTPSVASLERLGLVERQPDPDDRRSVLMVVSRDGQRLLADVRRERSAILTCRVGNLSPEQRQALVVALPVLERLVEDDPTG